MKNVILAAAILTLSACASTPEPAPAPPPPVAATPTVPVPAPLPADSCKSGDFQYLVGKTRSEIPVPTDPSKRRVACTTCPVTMDYRADRLNIFYDADTGIIKEVKCG